MVFCKGQCDFTTCKDLLCLLSNLVEHIKIAYGSLGSFSSFVLSTTKSRINLPIISQDFLCLDLDFQ